MEGRERRVLCFILVLLAFSSCLQAMRVTSRDTGGGVKTLWLDDYELGAVGSIPNATVRGTPGYEGWPTDPDGEWVTDGAIPGAFEGTKYLEIYDAWGAWIFDGIGYGIVQMRFAANLPSDTGGPVFFMFLSPWDGHQNKERCRFAMNPDGTLTYIDASLYSQPFKIAGDGNDMTFALDQWHVYVLDYNTVNGDMQLTVDGVVSQNVPFAEHHADDRLYGSVGLMWPVAPDYGHVYVDYAPPTVCGDMGTKYLLTDIAGPNGIGRIYSDCNVDFDDLAAMVQQWLQTTAAPVLLPVVNSSFETEPNEGFEIYNPVILPGWKYDGNPPKVAVSAKSGCPDGSSYALKFNSTSIYTSWMELWQNLASDVVIKAGYTYTLTADFSNGPLTGNWTGFEMELYARATDGLVQLCKQKVLPDDFTAADQWKKLSCTYTDDGSHAGERLRIDFTLVNGNMVWLDGIELYESEYPLADVAGPSGAGMTYRDSNVNFCDISVVAQQWLQCTDPVEPVDCPLWQ